MKLNNENDANFQLRCGSCNTIFQIPSPVPCEMSIFLKFTKSIKCPHCGAKKKIMMGQSRTISEDDGYPHSDHPDSSIDHRLALWLKNGEIGKSARAIAAKLTNRPGPTDHPLDLGDFRRCYLMIRRIPEFQSQIYLMEQVSPTWARLAPEWETITKLFEQESGPNLENYAASKTDEMLRRVVEA